MLLYCYQRNTICVCIWFYLLLLCMSGSRKKNQGGGVREIFLFFKGGGVRGQFLTILLYKFKKFTHTHPPPHLQIRACYGRFCFDTENGIHNVCGLISPVSFSLMFLLIKCTLPFATTLFNILYSFSILVKIEINKMNTNYHNYGRTIGTWDVRYMMAEYK